MKKGTRNYGSMLPQETRAKPARPPHAVLCAALNHQLMVSTDAHWLASPASCPHPCPTLLPRLQSASLLQWLICLAHSPICS